MDDNPNPSPQAENNPETNATWERVQLARHPKRPHTLDYINRIFTGFAELHGDRTFGDDPAIVGGMAFFEGRPLMVIGQQKGRDTKQKLHRNFGMPKPEGYRKALRLMKLAEKFGVPVITIVIGEGGSGGALGLGVANRVYMLENAYYSVITPEACAAIIYRDSGKAPEAARALRLASSDLLSLGLIDGIISEPEGGAHNDMDKAAEFVRETLQQALAELAPRSPEELVEDRYNKFRRMGNFFAEGQGA